MDDDDARRQMVSYQNDETQSSSYTRRLPSSQVKSSQVKKSGSH